MPSYSDYSASSPAWAYSSHQSAGGSAAKNSAASNGVYATPTATSKQKPQKILGIVATIIGIVGIAATIYVIEQVEQQTEQQAQQQTQVQTELDELTKYLEVPPGWEVRTIITTNPDARGYKASPDLSNSGTWLVITIATTNQENEFEQFANSIEASNQHPNAQLANQTTTTKNGHNGHLYEVTDMTGRKTGEPLGVYGAIYYGPQRTYEVLAQYEMPDKDTVGDMWTRTVLNLTLP